MNHLNTLLRDASADAPPDHLDLGAIVGAGRSRVRRRRAVMGIAAAAVVGLVTSLALAVPGDGRDQQPATDGVRTLDLDVAVPAEDGVDYEVLDEYVAHSTDAGLSGTFVRGVLPDGRVVLQTYPDEDTSTGAIQLIGPERSVSTDSPPNLDNYLGHAGRNLVFGGNGGLGLWLLDTESLRWRQVLEGQDLDVNRTAQPLSATGAPLRIYLPAGAAADAEERAIYEVDLDRGSMTELARGGDVAASAGRVAWTDAYDGPVGRVTLRDVRGGTTAFDPGTGRCVGKDLGLTADRIVLMTNCDDEAGDDEYSDIVNRIDVFDLDGRPLARITGDDLGPVRMTDAYLTISTWNEEQAGTYTYDLSDGEFLRVTDAMSGLAGLETGSGSILVWEERVDGDSGARYVVARMR